MIEILKEVLPYISGLYTLPWILVGFCLTILIAQVIGREKIDGIMKKIGIILLYFFIPVLLFRIFISTTFGTEEIKFSLIVAFIILLMYIIAYVFAKYQIKKQSLTRKKESLYLKTMLVNQGRSSAFIGSAMMAFWELEAGIFMALVGIALFAVIPYLLSHLHKNEQKHDADKKNPLPWFLKLYPWYLISFVVAAVLLHGPGNVTIDWSEPIPFVVKFFTAITIPAALYYVGAGIHPSDLKFSEIKKLLGLHISKDKDHWKWVRTMFVLTVVITPLIIGAMFGGLLLIELIPGSWFAVIFINAILPVTSTNMFLLPYGIDKRSTAHIVTWTTLVCVPIVMILIMVFSYLFP
jgi:competence protein ComGF